MAALQTVNGTSQNPDGSANALGTVSLQLSVSSAFISTTQELANSPVVVSTDGSGNWTVSLYSNTDITPASTTYGVTEKNAVGGAVSTYKISIPNVGGPFRASAITV